MSAMRIYNRVDFEQALKDNGFVESDKITAETTLWYHKEADKHITVSNEEQIPEFILNKYLSTVNRLYFEPANNKCSQKQFAVTEKITPLKVIN